MLPFAAVGVSPAKPNMWTTALYAGAATAVLAVLTAFFFQSNLLILWVLGLILIGIGPLIGYDLAHGQIGASWKGMIAGAVSFILPVVGTLLWGLLVGATSSKHGVGKLFIASLIGLVLGVAVFFILATVMGQNPSWVGTGFTFLFAVWGGSVGAGLAAWEK